MRLALFVASCAITGFITVGCNSSSMSSNGPSSSNTPKPSGNGTKINGDGSNDSTIISLGKLSAAVPIPGSEGAGKILEIERPFGVNENGSVDFSFDPAFPDKAKDAVGLRPLVVYFVLDVTSSMNQNIAAIKEGVSKFVSKLVEKKFDVKLGFLTFTDAVSSPNPLMDATTLSKSLTGINVAGGYDVNEASLTAFRQALSYSLSKAPADAVKAILTITDNPGHNDNKDGEYLARNCTIDATLTALNSLAKDQQSLVKIFYSVSSDTPATKSGVGACSGYDSARQQWDAVLNKSLPEIPLAGRGGALPYPFNGDVLVNDFVSLLEKTSPGADLICLTKKADLISHGEVIESIENTKFPESYKDYLASKPFVWSHAIPEDRLDKFLKNTDNQMKIGTCCVTKAAAEAGEFAKCQEEKTVTVKFKVSTR